MKYNHIAGVDEAGRGPLAGPVIAAAVILNPAYPILGLKDSKKLSAKQRERLFDEIQTSALCWSIGRAEVSEIDAVNILQATLLAMARAVEGLSIPPSAVEIDGNQCPVLSYPARTIVRGDQTVPAISAASILAKVSRDREMVLWDTTYPHYGFKQHKGYGTAQHLDALRERGPCEIHRYTFSPVAQAASAHAR